MKIRSMKTLGAAIAAMAVLFGAGLFRAADHTPSYRFQEAIDLMETKGDYPAAIRVFEELAKGADRNLAARSLLYAGLCYEKLGKDEARKAYERVLRDYADQNEAATEARTRLAALTQPANPSNGSTLATRQIWAGPEAEIWHTSFSPDGRSYYYTDWETGDLAVRDLSTGENRHLTNKGSWNESTEFALPSTVSPDGRQLVYAWFNNVFYDLRLFGLNGSGPRVLYSNKDMRYLDPAGWTPDGKYILANFSRNDGTNQIVLVSVADASVRVLKTLDWRYPLKMSLSPDGRYIAYDFQPREDSENRNIFLLATDGSREVPLVQNPANDLMPVWTPDGKKVVFLSDRGGTMGIWAIQVADGKPQGSAELVRPDLGASLLMGFTRNGALYYGTEIGTSDVYIAGLDAKTGKVAGPPTKAIERFVGSNSGPDWSPDGQSLAYASVRQRVTAGGGYGSRVIVVRSLKTGEERELSLKVHGPRIRACWSPDGHSFLLPGKDNKGRDGVYRIDAQTGDLAPLVRAEPGEGFGPAVWSADGTAVLYVHYGQEGNSVQIKDLKTGREKELYRAVPPAYVSSIAISPDGRQLALSATQPATRSDVLKVMPTAGGEPRELLKVREPENLEVDGVGGRLAWTPDGHGILFVKGRTQKGTDELWQIPAEGGEPQGLGLALRQLRDIRFDPEGRRIAFSAGYNKAEVWAMENFLAVLKASR